MRRENARQLIAHTFTVTLRPVAFPRITAIFPRSPYLSSYETVSRKAAGSPKKFSHSDSLNRLPLRLNWLVLLTNSNALTSPLCLPQSRTMEASAAFRKLSEGLTQD